MPTSKAMELPASPEQAVHIATQLASNNNGGKLIDIYQFGKLYCAFVDGVAYHVPSGTDTLEVSPRAEGWLAQEANMQAYHAHMMSRPDPADLIRHCLLDELVARNKLGFDLAWDTFRQKVEQTLFYVDLTVEGPAWHRVFTEEWWCLKAELEARS